jgi:hypothetical protein
LKYAEILWCALHGNHSFRRPGIKEIQVCGSDRHVVEQWLVKFKADLFVTISRGVSVFETIFGK